MNAWTYASAHPYVFLTWCLVKQAVRLHGLGQAQVASLEDVNRGIRCGVQGL